MLPDPVSATRQALVARLTDEVGAERTGAVPSLTELEARVGQLDPLASAATRRAVAAAVVARLGGIGVLDEVLADPEVAEVLVNGDRVWVERNGQLCCLPQILASAEVARLIEGIVGPAGARVDRLSPLVDVRLDDGSRANIVLPPIAADGPYVSIRRFVLRRAAVGDFAPDHVAELLADAVRRRVNIVVAGGTGTGKTTLLNALASLVPPVERIVTVEEVAELAIAHPHVVRLEARAANTEGVGEIGVRALVRNALRMRPDRIVVGEVRGAEVLDMAQAMNTGHAGSMSTCHANSPRDVLRRLEAMALLERADLSSAFVREQLAPVVELVVQLRRFPDGTRRIVGLARVSPDGDWRTGAGIEHMTVEV